MTTEERDLRFSILAEQGFTISMVYGSMADRGIGWSVNVLAPNNESFKKPFAATSIEHCLTIAEFEIRKRGWL